MRTACGLRWMLTEVGPPRRRSLPLPQQQRRRQRLRRLQRHLTSTQQHPVQNYLLFWPRCSVQFNVDICTLGLLWSMSSVFSGVSDEPGFCLMSCD